MSHILKTIVKAFRVKSIGSRTKIRKPASTLGVEQLESRLVPTVTYHGGALIANVGVEALFYGSDWKSGPTLFQQTGTLDGYLQYITNSSYMDMLTNAGYNVGRGTFLDGQIDLANLSGIVDDTQIRSELSSQISAGNLQQPDANRLYFVYVAPGIEVTNNGQNSINDFAGYHGCFAGPTGIPVNYAVIPYGQAGEFGLSSSLDVMTEVSSHELAEAVTDPQVNFGTLGWYDDQNGEIGDIVNGQYVYLNNYAVQEEAGQNDQALVPDGATSGPSQPPPPPSMGQPPVANDDTYTVQTNGTLNVGPQNGVLANDTDLENDPLTAVLQSNPAVGSLTFHADGSFTYTPNAGFLGFDSFTYVAQDIDGTSNVATVTIQVQQPAVQTYKEAFVLGPDDQVYGQWVNGLGQTDGGYFLTAPGQVRSFVVGKDANGTTEVFGVDPYQGQVYVEKIANYGQSPGGFTRVSTGQVESIQVGHDAANNLELFAIDPYHSQVYALKFDANGNPAGNFFLTAPGHVASIQAINDAHGNPVLFAIDPYQSQVYELKLTGAGQAAGGWSLVAPGYVQAIAVGNDGAGNPELFALDPYHSQVYGLKFDGNDNAVGAYFLAAGGSVQGITVGHDADNHPELFAIDPNTSQAYTLLFDANGNPLGGYTLAASGGVSALAVGYDTQNDPILYALGLDGRAYVEGFQTNGQPTGSFTPLDDWAVQEIAGGF